MQPGGAAWAGVLNCGYRRHPSPLPARTLSILSRKQQQPFPRSTTFITPLYRPDRPQTTRAKEKENMAQVAAQPRVTMSGSPWCVWQRRKE